MQPKRPSATFTRSVTIRSHIFYMYIYTHHTRKPLSMYVYICMYVCVLVCAWPSSESVTWPDLTCVTCRLSTTDLSCSRSRWFKAQQTNSNKEEEEQQQHSINQSINQSIANRYQMTKSLRCRRRILGVFPWNFSYSFTKTISIDKPFV